VPAQLPEEPARNPDDREKVEPGHREHTATIVTNRTTGHIGTHAICAPCWNARNPTQHVRTIRRLVMSERQDERADPKKLRCRGEHE
jgi:hypothetical protein